jgi:hypothetical protein
MGRAMKFLTAMLLFAGLASGSRVENIFGRLPLYFVENRGQVSSEVFYYVQGRDSVYFTSRGATLALTSEDEKHWAVAVDLVGARRGLKPEAERRTEAVMSYFKGPRPNWKPGIPTYGSVAYREAWPGIDLSWSGTAGRLENTFVVGPGADPRRIRLRYRGAISVKLDETGGLEVKAAAGGFRVDRPRAYQESEGKRVEIPVSFTVRRKGADPVYGFRLGRYDRGRPLVIDPVMLLYAGYIGGSGDDYGYGIAVDAAGNAYVTGETNSTEASFPVAIGPDLGYNGDRYDVFVAKVKADGSGLVYAGYIGGNNWDTGNAIAVDAAGNAYVAGGTFSNEATFPVTAGPDLTFNGASGTCDAFAAKVNADGTDLLYAGYIGGTGWDFGTGIAVDDAGNAYVGGRTNSRQQSFPVAVGPDLTYNGGPYDAFVAKVNSDGTGLVYAGYIGGMGEEYATALALDGAGNVYVTGLVDSTQFSFPVTVGPDLSQNGSKDAFVAKVRADGTGLLYAGYIGGSGADYGWGIAVDGEGSAYVTGETDSGEATFPVTVGPDLTYNGGPSTRDAFVVKVRADGTGFSYAGYIGGDGIDAGMGIAVDKAGNAYVVGETDSTEASFPVTVSPDLTYNGGEYDAFVAEVRADGTGLAYAGYIGGNDNDRGRGIAVDGSGGVYVTGWTSSTEVTFPIFVGPDWTWNGGDDAFVAKIGAPCLSAATPIRQVKVVKQPANLDNVDFTWLADPAGSGYNIWYVTSKEEISQARQSSSPPAIPVAGCAVPSAATAAACTDQGAVSRNAPACFFYQIRTYCDASNEGP